MLRAIIPSAMRENSLVYVWWRASGRQTPHRTVKTGHLQSPYLHQSAAEGLSANATGRFQHLRRSTKRKHDSYRILEWLNEAATV